MHVNRNGKEFDPRLVMLARRSPASYGAIIRVRNQVLLERLLLVPELVRDHRDAAAARTEVSVGCPHCRYDHGFDCGNCLWSAVAPVSGRSSCLYVPFPCGYTLSSISAFTDVNAVYGYQHARLYVRYATEAYTPDPLEISLCRGFLDDHVDWASLSCWGEEVGDAAKSGEVSDTAGG